MALTYMKNDIIVTASWVNHTTGANGTTELTHFTPEFKGRNRTNMLNDKALIDSLICDEMALIFGYNFMPEGTIIHVTYANNNTMKFTTYLYIIHSNFMGS